LLRINPGLRGSRCTMRRKDVPRPKELMVPTDRADPPVVGITLFATRGVVNVVEAPIRAAVQCLEEDKGVAIKLMTGGTAGMG